MLVVATPPEYLSSPPQSRRRTPSTPFNNVCSTESAHARQQSSYPKHISPKLMGRVQHFEAFFGQRVNSEAKAKPGPDNGMSPDMHPTPPLLKQEQRVSINSHRVEQRGSDGAGGTKDGIAASQTGESPRMETVAMERAGTADTASSKRAENSTSTPIRSPEETGFKSNFSKAVGPNLRPRFWKALKSTLEGAGIFSLKVTVAVTAVSSILALCCIPVAGPASLLIIPIAAVVTPCIAFPLAFGVYALGQFGAFVASSIIRYRKM